MTDFDELPEHMRTPEAALIVARKLLALAGIDPDRCKSAELFDAGMKGRGGMAYEIKPALTPDEEQRVKDVLISVSAPHLPPIFPAKA